MKENRIPFDIKYRSDIEAGRYRVETRDGRPARIVCWDFKPGCAPFPIVAIVSGGNYEAVLLCTAKGRLQEWDSIDDLFLVPVEQDACTITGWVARDAEAEAEGDVYMFSERPSRSSKAWMNEGHSYWLLPKIAFPSLHWDDEPIEVEVTIKRKEF